MNIYLKAASESALRTALAAAGYEFEGQYCTRFVLADWTHCENHTPGAIRHDVDIVGVISKQTGVDAEGQPVFTAQPGFHANLSAHESHAELAGLVIAAPLTPCRV